jgi:hypothetical protein
MNTQTNTHTAPSTRLAPLADILNSVFHIDISQDEPLLVQTESGFELPLSLLSRNEAAEIKERACDQYVKSVLSGDDGIDQHRATLFFISQFCSNDGRLVLHQNPVSHTRRASRDARKRADARTSVSRSVSA